MPPVDVPPVDVPPVDVPPVDVPPVDVPPVDVPPVDVILPVLNEAEALPWVLGRLPDGFRGIVVDNGSTDGSAAIAAALGARVISESRRGFGAACWAGLAAAVSSTVCFMDCDGSLDPAELLAVVGPVRSGAADLVMGSRRPSRGAWPAHARLANRYLARAASRRCGARIHDLGPMRAARRLELLDLGLEDRRFGWPLEMVLRAGAAGWRIAEVPVAYLPRRGRSKVTGTLGGTWRAARDMRRLLV
jgi:glycosyltransferase involved in cell wall biosynthesis